ncbi:BnaAnng15730D [Brassica napus]|uniref:BnaAnng15730D protein n=1 Tax=Brassica napus TaxID=3708 RepID=A0A078J4V9_BRANA|nr:BnaAnng15730D [Brassica napus]
MAKDEAQLGLELLVLKVHSSTKRQYYHGR